MRDGGRVVVCGHYTDNGAAKINPHWQMPDAGALATNIFIARWSAARFGADKPWREMLSGRFDLGDAAMALEAVVRRKAVKAIITPNRA